MAVIVAKLEGDEIPQDQRQEGVSVVFNVCEPEGQSFYFADDIEAAKKAVELSEVQKNRA